MQMVVSLTVFCAVSIFANISGAKSHIIEPTSSITCQLAAADVKPWDGKADVVARARAVPIRASIILFVPHLQSQGASGQRTFFLATAVLDLEAGPK
ncbi:MAG: hypothetical protein AMS18_10000 [Gemmatimonas sp. SG8_17]|nr:MAG: hypothetical protein AMS18_10000 [Gemmatimonas sp. SG8_17]